MSKNFNLLYVLAALLLHFFMPSSYASTKGAATALKQRNQLIEQYGLIENKLYSQLCEQITAQLKITDSCLLLNDKGVNAFAFADGYVMITWGLLKQTKNHDQLAHILAHEQAHLTLGHHQELANFLNKPPVFFPKKKLKKLRVNQEKQADQAANTYLIRSGFDTAQIHHLWRHLTQSEQHHKWSDHQRLNDRIDAEKLTLPEDTNPVWLKLIHDLSQR